MVPSHMSKWLITYNYTIHLGYVQMVEEFFLNFSLLHILIYMI